MLLSIGLSKSEYLPQSPGIALHQATQLQFSDKSTRKLARISDQLEIADNNLNKAKALIATAAEKTILEETLPLLGEAVGLAGLEFGKGGPQPEALELIQEASTLLSRKFGTKKASKIILQHLQALHQAFTETFPSSHLFLAWHKDVLSQALDPNLESAPKMVADIGSFLLPISKLHFDAAIFSRIVAAFIGYLELRDTESPKGPHFVDNLSTLIIPHALRH